MERRVKERFEALERLAGIHFRKEGMDVGAYASPNPLKRHIFYKRMLSLLHIFPFDLDEDATIVDFGAGQCLFSILLLSLGYRKVLSVDIDEGKLRQGLSLLRFYNETLGTDLALHVSAAMPDDEVSLVCAIDVFEHFTPEYARDVIQHRRVPAYLLNLPTENFLYDLGTFFHREPDHKMRYFEVVDIFKDCGFTASNRKKYLGLFNGYLMERAG
jgi:hypothetical protein